VKRLLIVMGIVFLCKICFADVEYSYEKIDDNTVKIIKTETNVKISEEELTLETLARMKATLIERKANALVAYNNTIVDLDKQIAEVEEKIAEAKKLGVVEVIE